jgi:hypothetical protein
MKKKFDPWPGDTETGEQLTLTERHEEGLSDYKALGYFGNIWVRSHYYKNAGDSNGGGHYHHFDHVTLLAVGSIEVEVEGQSPKRFDAPTFVVIKKDHRHKITALTDGVVYYCVFALRNEDGELTDVYDGSNSPYSGFGLDLVVEEKNKEIDLLKQKLRDLENKTTKK